MELGSAMGATGWGRGGCVVVSAVATWRRKITIVALFFGAPDSQQSFARPFTRGPPSLASRAKAG